MPSKIRLYRGPGRQTLKERFDRFVVQSDDPTVCWEWLGNRNRYGTISDHGRPVLAHRVSYQLHVGEIPAGLEILHSCDNTWCVNPKHLSAGTSSKNKFEAWERGLGRKARKLYPEDVIAIRLSTMRHCDLARQFNVSPSLIWHVRNGRIGDGVLKIVQPKAGG